MGACSRVLVGLTCFLQVMTAAAVIVITALKLHRVDVTWDQKTWNTDVSNVCLLGKLPNGGNLCYLAYIAGGASILATAALSLLQCCTCHLCGLGSILDAAFASAGTILWVICGLIFDQVNKQPDMAAVPRPEWRLSITILSFVACGLFGTMALAAVWSLLSACCGCCSCGGGGGSTRTRVVYRDAEAGKGQFMAR